ncbi:META domain-containing protein [Amaricoccus solimangrovi]|uniref:META domain-containing protein n=1 Tax=Amaricoccus solimangrovi TaxID=2589815 RepID=A0A501WR38_9RHOB|nr:META domain-containing protein [Amaricoccus solimangrovi]TPE50805.1 META domain-containing protein [Amaricoccus solimangrovi]
MSLGWTARALAICCLSLLSLAANWEPPLGLAASHSWARGIETTPDPDTVRPSGAPTQAANEKGLGPSQTAPPGSSAAVIQLANATGAEAPETGLGVELPASYGGEVPCVDCEALSYQLNLWPDHVFDLRRKWLPDGRTQDALGRWWIDTSVGRLILWDGEDKMEFAVLPGRLRLIDRDGVPDAAPESYDLTGESGTTPLSIRVSVRGMVSFLADRAQITECLTGRVYPLSTTKEFPTLEAAYLAAGVAQGTPLMASLQGRVLQEGDEEDGEKGPLVIVNRFTGVWPEETCEQAMSSRSLTNTYWRIVRLGKTEIEPAAHLSEPHLVLKEGENRFVATVGCNEISGGFERNGDKLNFKAPATTLKGCQPPLADWERMLAEALANARGWRVNGEALELLDSAGMQIALFQAEAIP